MKISKEFLYDELSKILELDIESIRKIPIDECLRAYGFTSIHSIQLIMMIENKYNIQFKDEDLLLERCDSISKILSTLESY